MNCLLSTVCYYVKLNKTTKSAMKFSSIVCVLMTMTIYIQTQRLKGSWILKKRVSSNFENKLRWTGKKFFKNSFMWPCSDNIQINRTLVYSILHATARANWHRKLYSNSIEQPPTVNWLCTVANLLLCQTITKCLP